MFTDLLLLFLLLCVIYLYVDGWGVSAGLIGVMPNRFWCNFI